MRTIKASEDISSLLKGGKRISTPFASIFIGKTSQQRDQYGRVAVAAGKRLGNAVFRNRCRRVMRASIQRLGGPWPLYDVVFVAHHSIASASYMEIDNAFLKGLYKGKVIENAVIKSSLRQNELIK